MKKIFFVSVLGVGVVNALQAMAVTINPNIPGASSDSSVPGLIANIYNFAMIAAGILAFGAIVYGGIRYAAGRGNPSEESDAKSRIWNALLGILLLAGAYLILSTINPNLVSLNLPNIDQTVTATSSSTPQANPAACGACGGTCNGTCPTSQSCVQNLGTSYSCTTSCTGVCGGACNGTCPGTQTCANLGYGYVCS